MTLIQKLKIPTVLAVVVITGTLAVASCGDDDDDEPTADVAVNDDGGEADAGPIV